MASTFKTFEALHQARKLFLLPNAWDAESAIIFQESNYPAVGTSSAAVAASLGYEDETAGRLMQREVLAAPQFWTVGDALDHVRASSDALPELFFDLYVIDPAFKPVGAVPVSQLLRVQLAPPPAAQLQQRQRADEIDFGALGGEVQRVGLLGQRLELGVVERGDEGR